MPLLDALLRVEKKERTVLEIIGWWEIRRLLYNVILLIAGFISIRLLFALKPLEPTEELGEPLLLWLFVIFCNIGYTLGWFTELFMKRSKSYAPKMFSDGVKLTLFVVFLPVILNVLFLFFDLFFN